MRISRAVPLLAVLIGACTAPFGPSFIPLDSYQPVSPPMTWKEPQRPRLYLDRVVDQAGALEMITVGAPILFRPPLAEALKQALGVEFARLGILAASPKDADASLDAAVTAASAELVQPGFGSFQQKVVAGLELTLTVKVKDGSSLWTGDVKGVGEVKGNLGGPARYSRAVNLALVDALGKIGPLLESENIAARLSRLKTVGAPELVVRSDIDELPAGPAAARRRAHAIVIGAGRYRQNLPGAEFADSDARLVSKYLTGVLGYPEENVAALINEQAARSDFEKYFERWLPNRVEAGDEVFIYYAGHGAPDPATGEGYLVPFDGDPTYLGQTAYPLKLMYSALARLPAGKITVVMDSCFSGAGGRSVLAKGARPLVTVKVGGLPSENMTVLSASAGDQISHTYEEKGHGLFTYFFLKGIKEEVRDGDVDMRDVFEFAASQVSRIARRDFNSDQVPQLKGGRP